MMSFVRLCYHLPNSSFVAASLQQSYDCMSLEIRDISERHLAPAGTLRNLDVCCWWLYDSATKCAKRHLRPSACLQGGLVHCNFAQQRAQYPSAYRGAVAEPLHFTCAAAAHPATQKAAACAHFAGAALTHTGFSK